MWFLGRAGNVVYPLTGEIEPEFCCGFWEERVTWFIPSMGNSNPSTDVVFGKSG